MYELEYLYEDLKTKMVEEAYINTLDAVISESYYDTHSARKNVLEAFNTINEASTKSKSDKLKKVKNKFTAVKKNISRRTNKAKNKLIGLKNDTFKKFSSDKKFWNMRTEAVNYLREFDVTTASDDELREFIKECTNNIKLRKVYEFFDMKGTSFAYPIVESYEEKELTETDIQEAMDFINNYEDTFFKLQENFKKIDKEYNSFVNESVFLNGLRRTASMHQNTLINIANNIYCECMIDKLECQLNQHKQNIVKADNYDPRNLKESAKIQDFIDAMYEFGIDE